MKAQGSVELIVIIAFIASFIVFVVVPWFSQAEYSLALSAARLSAHTFAEAHAATLKQLAFTESSDGKTITITPSLSRTLSNADALSLRLTMYASISNIFFKLNSAPPDACVQGPTKKYCVVYP